MNNSMKIQVILDFFKKDNIETESYINNYHQDLARDLPRHINEAYSAADLMECTLLNIESIYALENLKRLAENNDTDSIKINISEVLNGVNISVDKLMDTSLEYKTLLPKMKETTLNIDHHSVSLIEAKIASTNRQIQHLNKIKEQFTKLKDSIS